jgi:CRISPR system Cascade subunit CasE
MYLSRLLLNSRSRQVQREVVDPYQRHRTIMAAFPEDLPESERILHRLETDSDCYAIMLLVQSLSRPDWGWLEDKDYLQPSGPFMGDPNPAVKRFDLTLRAGQVLRFRLRANPTVKKKRPGKPHGNRVPLVREERQREWLARKGDQHGFRVLDVLIHSKGDRQGWVLRNGKGRHRLTLHVVQFDGLLKVRDPAKVELAVQEGIGPAKAFGCGLLSLAIAPSPG